MIAEKRGIQNPQNMYTKELLNTLSRCDSKGKVNSIHIKYENQGEKILLKYKIYVKMILIRLKRYKKNQQMN